MRIIGLSGLSGSGKSTAANRLLSSGFYLRHFATPIKDFANTVFQIPYDLLYGDSGSRNQLYMGHDVRKLLQDIGSFGRSRDLECWIKHLFAEFDGLPQYRWPGKLGITDVRFYNEIQAIRNRGGVVWRVLKEGQPPPGDDAHESESELGRAPDSMFDRVLRAAPGDHESLYKQLANGLKEMGL